MLDGDLFDKLAHIAARFRRKPDKPFGGIQLIMTGDFFQLPPVTKGGMPRFAFEANSWKTCIDMTVNLTKVFRQKDTGRLRSPQLCTTYTEYILQSSLTCSTKCGSANYRKRPSPSFTNLSGNPSTKMA